MMKPNLYTLPKEDRKPIIESLVKAGLSETVANKEISFAVQLLRQNARLQQCNRASIMAAVVNVGNIGLTLNPVSKESYLIPRWNSATRSMEAKLEPSYIGLIRLITQNGLIRTINAQLVFEADEFQINLADVQNPVLHRPCLSSQKRKESKTLGCYVVATFSDYTRQVEWMDLEEIEKIKACSEGYKAYSSGKTKSCIWVSHFGEMARKTVVKRIYKYLPRGENEKIDKAIDLTNEEYGAELWQLHQIELLLGQANIAEKTIKLIEAEMNDYSRERANNCLKFLKENTPDFWDGSGNMSDAKKAVMSAVDRPNT